MLFFIVALVVALSSRQYSHSYYGAFALIHASSASMYMNVLPSDNAKVKILLFVTAGKYVVACVCSAFFSYRTAKDVEDGTCENCDMSKWEIWFWRIHCGLAFLSCLTLLRTVRSPPRDMLNKLWKIIGIYFVICGLVGLVDHAMAVVTGVHHSTSCSSLRWNLLITTEELAIGLLSSSSRFKLWIWAKATAKKKNRTRARSFDAFVQRNLSPTRIR